MAKMGGMSSNPENQFDATRLMLAAAEGNHQASEDLLPLVYGQLRAIAAQRMKLERPDHTLQPTALVHEAFLKLVGPRSTPWSGEAHFFAAAANRSCKSQGSPKKRGETSPRSGESS